MHFIILCYVVVRVISLSYVVVLVVAAYVSPFPPSPLSSPRPALKHRQTTTTTMVTPQGESRLSFVAVAAGAGESPDSPPPQGRRPYLSPSSSSLSSSSSQNAPPKVG